MDMVSWVLVLSIYSEAALPDSLAEHKEFKTYEQCYKYRDRLRKYFHAPNKGFNRSTPVINRIHGHCVPVSNKDK